MNQEKRLISDEEFLRDETDDEEDEEPEGLSDEDDRPDFDNDF